MPGRNVTVAFIHLVGPVGAGKSTMLQRAAQCDREFMATLAALPNFAWLQEWVDDDCTVLVVVPEDPSRWVNGSGNSLLSLMSVDPHTYALPLQSTILRDRVEVATTAALSAIETLPANKKRVLVVAEGTIEVDCGVYTAACVDKGFMTIEQWRTYNELYLELSNNWLRDLEADALNRGSHVVQASSRGTLHLSTPIDESIERVKRRGRACEQTLIPHGYYENIAKRHDELLSSTVYRAGPVARIFDSPLDAKNPIGVMCQINELI